MEKRIQNASSLLDTSLGHCFVDGLTHKDENAVYNCLRAYAAVDNTQNAEDIFRSTVVAPLVQKVIPYSSSGVVSGSAGDELEEDYKQIKHLIAEDCTFLLQISSTENSGFHVFSFLANSILKEVLWAIQHGKPGAFSPGRPTEFLKNYKSSLGFLADLEGYCPSRSAVANFRAEAVYVDFMKQWNIGVYFSLRFQEIAGSLDSALVGSRLNPIQKSDSEHGLTLKQSLTLLECLKSCWREDVLLISISDKFLRLTLQLLSRYVNWLSAGLSARKNRNSGPNSPFEWAVSAAPDDLIYVIHDLDHLAADVCGNFIGHVFEILKSCSTEEVDLVKDSILQGGKSLKDLVPSVIDSIIDTLAEKCSEEVQQLQGIVAAYRMTKKPPPVRHSHYVSGVLRPLKVFLDGERATTYLTEDTKGKLVQGAAFKITGRYYELAADTVNTARKTETSLQRIRQGARARHGASSDTSGHNVTETDKICMQLFLDIQEYGRNLATLGVEAANIPSYTSLWQLVAPQDRQAEIRF
ncbi:hypothetical protein CTI12_AA393830 [Artemisia annua]|nr:hypothetical protein CTI12_AA393830 [Artemisia annua]